MASEGDRRAGPDVADGSSKIAGLGAGGPRGVAIALASTAVFFVLLALAVTHAPGWHEVHRAFFSWSQFHATLPEISRAFLLNVKIFCIAEALILVAALILAVVRSLPGPVFFPLRALAIGYADFFRGVPTILVIVLLGFGAPGLGLKNVPTSTTFWGIVALVLVYTAYVSEVYRAGIESVHPSQEAAARSLGLRKPSKFSPRRHLLMPAVARPQRDPAHVREARPTPIHATCVGLSRPLAAVRLRTHARCRSCRTLDERSCRPSAV